MSVIQFGHCHGADKKVSLNFPEYLNGLLLCSLRPALSSLQQSAQLIFSHTR